MPVAAPVEARDIFEDMIEPARPTEQPLSFIREGLPRPWTLDSIRAFPQISFLSYDANVLGVLQHRVRPGLRFGMELEINPEAGWSRENLLRALQVVHEQNPYFIVKRDGSVSRGVEIVTLPLSFDEMSQFAQTLLPLPGRADTNCGIHFHISRNALNNAQLWRMMQFINCAPAGSPTHDFLDQVARRRQNTYCHRSYFQSLPRETSHYAALGYSGRWPTCELRIFASTNKPLYLLSYIQFTKALIEYCREENSRLFEFRTPFKFIAFVQAHATEYPQLAQRFRHPGFRAIMAEMASQASVSTGETPENGETATPGVVSSVRRRFHPVTRERERRVATEVPATNQVRAWLSNHFGVDTDPVECASRIQGRAVGWRASQREYVLWYANNCVDNETGERQYIRTQRGSVIRGVESIRSHALYHLQLIRS